MYFVRLIVIAILIAFPAFYIIDKMVTPDLFASTADAGFIPYAYLCSGLLALISGLVAVILQTVKVARANPVDSLRYE
jgi:ABC-type antimicrobial peptide transport system permease subunit